MLFFFLRTGLSHLQPLMTDCILHHAKDPFCFICTASFTSPMHPPLDRGSFKAMKLTKEVILKINKEGEIKGVKESVIRAHGPSHAVDHVRGKTPHSSLSATMKETFM